MKRVVCPLMLAAMLAGAAWAQAPTDELSAQLAMERWTFWMMVTGAVSALFAFLGFVGVMMTLREQRHLTHAQERAVLRWDSMTLFLFWGKEAKTYTWQVMADVENIGRTHAVEVHLDVNVEVREYSHFTDGSEPPPTVKKFKTSDRVGLIEAAGNRRLVARSPPLIGGEEPTVLAYNRTNTYQLQTELRFKDVFGRRHVARQTFHERAATGNVIRWVEDARSIEDNE